MISFSYGVSVGMCLVMLVLGGLLQDKVFQNSEDISRIKERMNLR